jgi:hypothetical protein
LRILPELEAYRDRLLTKAALWPDQSSEELGLELERCRDQLALLTKAVADLKARVAGIAPASGVPGTPEAVGRPGGAPAAPVAAPESDASMGPDRLAHRLEVQEQTRDLTAAYAEALRRHLEKRAAAI